MGGDHVTGEDTYSHQQAEIDETLDEQVEIAYEIYIEHIQRLAERFPAVQVVCQPGNHGAIEGKYSEGANADRLLYASASYPDILKGVVKSKQLETR